MNASSLYYLPSFSFLKSEFSVYLNVHNVLDIWLGFRDTMVNNTVSHFRILQYNEVDSLVKTSQCQYNVSTG